MNAIIGKDVVISKMRGKWIEKKNLEIVKHQSLLLFILLF